MKQPVIEIDGKSYPVHSITWYEDGRLCSASFYIGNDHFTAFNKIAGWDTEGLKEDGTAHFDLYECLKWSEPDA